MRFPATILFAFLLALAAAASATQVVFVSPVRAAFLYTDFNHVEDAGNITAGDTLTFLAEINASEQNEPPMQWTSLSAESAFLPSGWTALPPQLSGGRLLLTLNSSPLISGLFLVKLRASKDNLAQTAAFRVNVRPAPPAPAPQPGAGEAQANGELMVYLLAGAVLLFVFAAVLAVVMRRRKPRSYAERAKAKRKKAQQQSIFEMMKGGEAEGPGIKTTKRGLPFFKPRETKFETLESVEKRMSAAAKVPVQVPKEEKKIDYKSKSTQDLVGEIDSALRELKPKREWKLKEEKEK